MDIDFAAIKPTLKSQVIKPGLKCSWLDQEGIRYNSEVLQAKNFSAPSHIVKLENCCLMKLS